MLAPTSACSAGSHQSVGQRLRLAGYAGQRRAQLVRHRRQEVTLSGLAVLQGIREFVDRHRHLGDLPRAGHRRPAIPRSGAHRAGLHRGSAQRCGHRSGHQQTDQHGHRGTAENRPQQPPLECLPGCRCDVGRGHQGEPTGLRGPGLDQLESTAGDRGARDRPAADGQVGAGLGGGSFGDAAGLGELAVRADGHHSDALLGQHRIGDRERVARVRRIAGARRARCQLSSDDVGPVGERLGGHIDQGPPDDQYPGHAGDHRDQHRHRGHQQRDPDRQTGPPAAHRDSTERPNPRAVLIGLATPSSVTRTARLVRRRLTGTPPNARTRAPS